MKKIILIVLVAFMASAFAPVQAQKKTKEVKTSATVFEKTRGADPNITTAKPTDDTKAVEKEKSRGDLCTITINNYSAYSVDIYVDGTWEGTISGYSKAYTYAYPGTTKIYGKSIGGTFYWGPQTFDCDYTYTWNLWE